MRPSHLQKELKESTKVDVECDEVKGVPKTRVNIVCSIRAARCMGMVNGVTTWSVQYGAPVVKGWKRDVTTWSVQQGS